MEFSDLLTLYDNINSHVLDSISDPVEGVFAEWVKRYQIELQKYEETKKEAEKLHKEKEELTKDLSVKDRVITNTRRLVDSERHQRKVAEKEREQLRQTVSVVRGYIDNEHLKPQNEETHESLLKLPYLTNDRQRKSKSMGHSLSMISEVDSASLSISRDNLSDFDSDEESFSRTRSGKCFRMSKDRDVSVSRAAMKKRSVEIARRNAKSIVATTEVIVPTQGAIEARTVINASKPPRHRRSFSEPNKLDPQHETDSTDSSSSSRKRTRAGTVVCPPKTPVLEETPNRLYPQLPKINSIKQLRNRQHNFVSKSVLKPENCGPCKKRMRFGKQSLKCVDCGAICHLACKEYVPLPCVPVSATPTQKMNKYMRVLADYAPVCRPMIPALVVHCIEEVEKRGLNEEGIYRKSESKDAVELLKQKFFKGKGVPNLSKMNVHMICGVLKSFLRDLNDPVIPNSSWKNFVDAAEVDSEETRERYFKLELNEMPCPNRDTLALLMLHFIKVSKSPLCLMSKDNLARILGPTILGYSVKNPESHVMYAETPLQAKVMNRLLDFGEDFWNDVIDKQDIGEQQITPLSTTGRRARYRL